MKAMEFLMTYGWAILVVLIALGALAYFGVFDEEFKLSIEGNKTISQENLTDWEKIYYNVSKYVPDYIDKQFEEIQNGEIYCETTRIEREPYCDWSKGLDEKWREVCYSLSPVFKEECFMKSG